MCNFLGTKIKHIKHKETITWLNGKSQGIKILNEYWNLQERKPLRDISSLDIFVSSNRVAVAVVFDVGGTTTRVRRPPLRAHNVSGRPRYLN